MNVNVIPYESANPRTSNRAGDGALYLVLLVLVWGLTVPARGLFQDDTLLLRLARAFQDQGLAALFTPVVSPVRRLYSLPFSFALATASPVLTLHLIFGLVWLGQALAAGWIAQLLLPGQQRTRFLAICLTLTATSDYLTDNLTALGYNIAALAFLLAVGCALCYQERLRLRWLGLSCAALTISIWTLDVAIPALPFVPLLLLWRGGLRSWRRLLLVLLAWGLSLAPAARLEWLFLHDPSGYASVAVHSMPVAERVLRTASLWGENFAPWRWAFARPVWYSLPPAVIPIWVSGVAAALGAAWFALRLKRTDPEDPAPGFARTGLLIGGLAIMALAANAAYANVQMAEVHYRTHILSRIWASLAVAILVGAAARRWPRGAAGFLLVPTLFVGFGVWGGMERQDLLISTWRLHQKELMSIVTNAPAVTPGTGIILRSAAPMERYLATAADYLTQSWLILLYDDPAIHGLRLAPDRGTGCRAAADALECWHENQADCFAAGTCPADRFPYDSLVVMDFDARQGTYRLLADPYGDPLFAGMGAPSYRPEQRILKRHLTPRQRALLLQQ
jgi:hypothetical protein